MSYQFTIDTLVHREQQERDLAARAKDSHIAAIHLELAETYARRLIEQTVEQPRGNA